MAYFAKIENNVVTNMIVADDVYFPIDNLGGMWVETYTDRPDKNYAGIGMFYDEVMDDFIDIQPFNSWNLVGNKWEAPVARQVGEEEYVWDEINLMWKSL